MAVYLGNQHICIGIPLDWHIFRPVLLHPVIGRLHAQRQFLRRMRCQECQHFADFRISAYSILATDSLPQTFFALQIPQPLEGCFQTRFTNGAHNLLHAGADFPFHIAPKSQSELYDAMECFQFVQLPERLAGF